jgi:hypothetical protein
MERPQTGVLTPPRRTSLTAIAAPGPILRGPVGDLFNVTLIYDATMPHSIDLYASRTATDKSMRELAPGQSAYAGRGSSVGGATDGQPH